MPGNNSRPSLKTTFLTCSLIIIASIIAQLIMGFVRDLRWHLLGAIRMLEGEKLHTDMLEINALPIYALEIIPILVSRIFGITPINASLVVHYGLLILSLFLIYKLIIKSKKSLSWLIVITLCLTLLTQFLAYEFGQKEHLLIILFMPYLFYRIFEIADKQHSQKFRILIGVLAAIGICIKPFYVVIPVFIELLRLVKTKDPKLVFFDPINLSLGITGSVIATYIIFFTDFIEMLSVDLQFYFYYRREIFNIEMIPNFVYPLTCAVFLLLSQTRATYKIGLLFGVNLLSVGIIFWQSKFFPYHFIPLTSFLAITAYMLWKDISDKKISNPTDKVDQIIRHGSAVIFLFLMLYYLSERSDYIVASYFPLLGIFFTLFLYVFFVTFMYFPQFALEKKKKARYLKAISLSLILLLSVEHFATASKSLNNFIVYQLPKRDQTAKDVVLEELTKKGTVFSLENLTYASLKQNPNLLYGTYSLSWQADVINKIEDSMPELAKTKDFIKFKKQYINNNLDDIKRLNPDFIIFSPIHDYTVYQEQVYLLDILMRDKGFKSYFEENYELYESRKYFYDDFFNSYNIWNIFAKKSTK